MAVIVSVCYKAGVPFDEAYYFGQHVPMAGPFFQKVGVQRAEIIKLNSPATGKPPHYQIIANLHFESLEAAQAALADPDAAPLMADIKNFFHGEPDILFGEVAVAM